jgi:hypothetical protein
MPTSNDKQSIEQALATIEDGLRQLKVHEKSFDATAWYWVQMAVNRLRFEIGGLLRQRHPQPVDHTER